MTHEIDIEPGPPPDTVLPPQPDEAIEALAAALTDASPKEAVGHVVAGWPRFLDAWARLGALADDPVESYAYFRIGYHRGLDALRGAGWRGRGFVRWSEESNRGFLRALAGLGRAAASISETDEVERIAQFLDQLDPDRPDGI
jgi:Protein of unknown function (DUF3151)